MILSVSHRVHDLQFIKGIVGINSNVSDGDVVETLVKIFKQKKIGQLVDGKNYKIPLDSDLVTFFNDKDAQRTIKEYEYLLNEKVHWTIILSIWILLAK